MTVLRNRRMHRCGLAGARHLLVVLLLGFSAAACATYREQLNRGQRLYEENQYERALALFRNLDPDVDSLSSAEQSRYYYLRGMTDYRLGYRSDARHFLATALAADAIQPGGLSPEWRERLQSSLTELNHEVYGGKSSTGELTVVPAASVPNSGAVPQPAQTP